MSQMGLKNKHVISFYDIFQIIKLRRKVYYFFISCFVFGNIAQYFLYIPTYTSSTTLNIQQPQRNAFDFSYDPGESTADLIKKYLRYMRSGHYYLTVAQTLKFKENYETFNLINPSELGLFKKDFWSMLVRRSNSTSNDEIIKRVHFDASALPEPVLIPVEKLGPIVQNLTRIDSDNQSSVTIRVRSLDPATSAVVANTAAEVFLKLTRDKDFSEVSEVRQFIEGQLKSATEKLKLAELDLVNFKKKNNIITLDIEQKGFTDRLSKIDTDLESGKIQKEQNEKLIEFYEKKLDQFEMGLLTETPSGVMENKDLNQDLDILRKRLDTLRKQRDLMLGQGFNDSSDQLKKINLAILDISKRLRKTLDVRKDKAAGQQDEKKEDERYDPIGVREKIEELKKSNKVLETQIATLSAAKDKLLKDFKNLPQDQQIMMGLTHKHNLQFELYSLLSKKLQEVEVQKISSKSRISLDEPASLPGAEPRPSLLLSLIFATLIGMFLASLSALAMELLDPTIKTPADMEEFELTVFCEIPHIEESKMRKSLGTRIFRPDLLVCLHHPQSAEAMVFKYLRTQLRKHLGPDGNIPKVITVTGPGRGDGKSLVAANLAVCYSQLDVTKKSIIIDCDINNPDLCLYFGYREQDGLTSVLKMRALFEDVVIKDRVPNLDILPAGYLEEHSSELIGDDKFVILLEFLKSEYDVIILDSPGILISVDATILANHSDIVLMVGNYRKTKKDAVLSAHQRIIQACHKRVQAVITNVPIRYHDKHSHSNVHSLRQDPFNKEKLRRTHEEKLKFWDKLKTGKK